MEIILNLAWAFCSLGLICLWLRSREANPVSRRTQVLALGVVLLLLFPVISVSDDLMAVQSPSETDSCLRRALQSDGPQNSVVPASLAMPEQVVTGLPVSGFSSEALVNTEPCAESFRLAPSLDSRPPPRV